MVSSSLAFFLVALPLLVNSFSTAEDGHIPSELHHLLDQLDRLQANYEAQIATLEARLQEKVRLRQQLEAELSAQKIPLMDGQRAVAMPTSCRDLNGIGHNSKGFYMIKAPGGTKIDTVYCDFTVSPAGNLKIKMRSCG